VNNLSIRQAVLTDLEALSVLFDGYRVFYGQESDVAAARDFLRARFEHGESTLFIALNGNTAVGFTQLYPSFSSVSLARIYILNDLFVHESARRKGAGAQLLAAAISFGKSVGAIRLALSTACDNIKAQALYEAEGWERDDDFFYTYTIQA
jgi:GNAT superfamily N-acetyltransferase